MLYLMRLLSCGTLWMSSHTCHSTVVDYLVWWACKWVDLMCEHWASSTSAVSSRMLKQYTCSTTNLAIHTHMHTQVGGALGAAATAMNAAPGGTITHAFLAVVLLPVVLTVAVLGAAGAVQGMRTSVVYSQGFLNHTYLTQMHVSTRAQVLAPEHLHVFVLVRL